MHRTLLASLVAASASLVTLPAAAQTVSTTHTTAGTYGYAIDPSGWSLAVLLGLGVNNDVGFGLGARGGYTFDNHLYVGGTLLDHFGSDLNLFVLGGEVGYDFIAGPVVIRPYGGLGFAIGSQSVNLVTPAGTESSSVSNTELAFWPGVQVLYTFPQNDRFFVGGDARVYIISDYSTFAMYGFGGMHF